MTLRETALTQLATLKTALDIDSVDEDETLERLIEVASDQIRRFLRARALHYETGIVEKVSGYGTHRLILSRRPVLSVSSIVLKASDPAGADHTYDSDSYEIEDGGRAGMVFRREGWVSTARGRGFGVGWGGLTGTEQRSIEVTYTGGWVTPEQADSSGWAGPERSLPYDVEEACIDAVVARYEARGGDPRIKQERLGSHSVSYERPSRSGLPVAVEQALAPYRRISQGI